MANRAGSPIRRAGALFCALVLPLSVGFAQVSAAPPPVSTVPQQAAPLLSPDQLDNLVAPVALYPDPLLSQVLAASTYPLEVVEAEQWLQQNSNLEGAQLMDAAKQQNWDPSVQALVAFPDALKLLGNDVRWTTDLGDAFLAQQSDVMSAVQAMRARAQANGKLATTPQQVVTTDTQNSQSAIEIQPADPQVIYVPVYDPAYVWGPPVWGAYPDLWYPDYFGFGVGFGFGPGIYMSSYFPGWGGWGGYGWGYGWFGNSLFVNTVFFNRYGYRGGYGGGFAGRGFGGRGAWAHDPGHRMGVPYPNRNVASRFNSSRYIGSGANGRRVGGGTNGRRFSNVSRGNNGQVIGGRSNSPGQGNRGLSNRSAVSTGTNAGGWRRFGDNRTATNGNAGSTRQASPNYNRASSQGNRAPALNNRASNSAQSYRSQPSYNRSSASAYSAPRTQSSSTPRSYSASAPSRSSSAPRLNAAPSRSFSTQRSYSAPNRSFSTPRSYSAPRAQSFSAPRSYSAPSRSFSSGTRSSSAPRSSGGGSGFSGGHASSGGGHAGGGGRRR